MRDQEPNQDFADPYWHSAGNGVKTLNGKHSNHKHPKVYSIDELLASRITSQTKARPLEPLVRIGRKDRSIFAARGDLSFITGQAKSGKSTIGSIIIASALTNNQSGDFLEIYAEPCQGRKIVYIDTEQSDQSLVKFRDNICKYAGLAQLPEHVYILAYAGRERAERLEMIKQLMENEEMKDTHLWLIDGIIDLIGDMNNIDQSNEVLDYFGGIAKKQNMGIIFFIHENPGSAKMTGHLGTGAERKCAGTIAVKKDRAKQVHSIEPRLFRHSSDFEPIYFNYCPDSRRMVSLYGAARQDAQKTMDRETQKTEELRELAETCFEGDHLLMNKALVARIRNETGVSARSANTKIKEMLERQILAKVEGKYTLYDEAIHKNNAIQMPL
ncbi:MAG: hypothetical protein HC880_06900 [Bacteroidia bacterium]|nr:hypothetical protein [Bacteroidia bacterium]